jgi:hypothetical protein
MRIFRQTLLSTVAFFVTCSQLQANEIQLTDDGQSEYVIALSETASPSEQHAAGELQNFLEEISGAKLPIVDGGKTSDRMIVLGNGEQLRSLKVQIDFADLGDEGFVIKSAGPHLVIAGGRLRGTMYGVYTFLEDVLGCRWYTSKVSHIPKKPSITLKDLDIAQKPDFEYREPFYFDAFDGDWAARNKSNSSHARLDEARGGKITFYPFVHTFARLVPIEKYFRQHPEYYALVGGARKAEGENDWQLCLTHPEVLKIATKTVLRWVEEHPEATVYSVSQNDGFGGNCECEKCTAIDEEEGSPSGLMLRFANAIAEEVVKKHPDKLIDTLAYTYTERPPKITRPHPNVRVRLAPIQICHSHPLDKCSYAKNIESLENLKGWGQLSNQQYIWHYTTTFNNYLLPYPNLEEIVGDIRIYKNSAGAKGLLAQGNYHGHGGLMNELQAYLVAKLLWNTEVDAEAVKADFLEGYFGKSGKPLGEFIDLMHEKVRKEDIHVFHWDPPDAAFLSPEIMAAGERLFDEAEKLADNADVLDRVRHARISIQYVKLAKGNSSTADPGFKGEEVTVDFEDPALRGKEEFEVYGARWSGGVVKSWSTPDLHSSGKYSYDVNHNTGAGRKHGDGEVTFDPPVASVRFFYVDRPRDNGGGTDAGTATALNSDGTSIAAVDSNTPDQFVILEPAAGSLISQIRFSVGVIDDFSWTTVKAKDVAQLAAEAEEYAELLEKFKTVVLRLEIPRYHEKGSMAGWLAEMEALYGRLPENVVYDLYQNLDHAKTENCRMFERKSVERDGGTFIVLLQHPPDEGLGDATYQVPLPTLESGKKLALRFSTCFREATANGVGFTILVDGKEVWSGEQKEMAPVEHSVDLSGWAGKTIALTLRVDALGNGAYDWSCWVRPQIEVSG